MDQKDYIKLLSESPLSRVDFDAMLKKNWMIPQLDWLDAYEKAVFDWFRWSKKYWQDMDNESDRLVDKIYKTLEIKNTIKSNKQDIYIVNKKLEELQSSIKYIQWKFLNGNDNVKEKISAISETIGTIKTSLKDKTDKNQINKLLEVIKTNISGLKISISDVQDEQSIIQKNIWSLEKQTLDKQAILAKETQNSFKKLEGNVEKELKKITDLIYDLPDFWEIQKAFEKVYTKNETYSKKEVDTKINKIKSWDTIMLSKWWWASSLESLEDVSITDPSSGQTLIYNWSQWVNWNISWWSLEITQTTHWFDVLDWVRYNEDTTIWTKADATIEDNLWHRHIVEVIDADNFKVAKDWVFTISNTLDKGEYILSTTPWEYTQTIPTEGIVLYGMEVINETTVSLYTVAAYRVGESSQPWGLALYKITTSLNANHYYAPHFLTHNPWGFPSTWNYVYYTPFLLHKETTVEKLAIKINLVEDFGFMEASRACIWIYSSDEEKPDERLYTTGQLEVSSAWIKEKTSVWLTLQANTLYFLAVITRYDPDEFEISLRDVPWCLAVPIMWHDITWSTNSSLPCYLESQDVSMIDLPSTSGVLSLWSIMSIAPLVYFQS